jgi:hypothetical protein
MSAYSTILNTSPANNEEKHQLNFIFKSIDFSCRAPSLHNGKIVEPKLFFNCGGKLTNMRRNEIACDPFPALADVLVDFREELLHAFTVNKLVGRLSSRAPFLSTSKTSMSNILRSRQEKY